MRPLASGLWAQQLSTLLLSQGLRKQNLRHISINRSLHGCSRLPGVLLWLNCVSSVSPGLGGANNTELAGAVQLQPSGLTSLSLSVFTYKSGIVTASGGECEDSPRWGDA